MSNPRCHRCSTTLEPVPGAVHLGVSRCPICRGGFIAASGGLDSILASRTPTPALRRCPFCRARAVPGGTRCVECSGALGVLCPGCEEPTRLLESGSTLLEVCPACSGVWIEGPEMSDLLDRLAGEAGTLGKDVADGASELAAMGLTELTIEALLGALFGGF